MKAKHVLFVCVHNAGRSQMAAGFFNQLADPEKAYATSAGLDPAPEVRPDIVAVMKEVGVDLSGVSPEILTARLQTEIQFLVTVGCGESCPLIPPLRRADWKIEDPKGLPLPRVREIRDEVRGLVAELVEDRGWGRAR